MVEIKKGAKGQAGELGAQRLKRGATLTRIIKETNLRKEKLRAEKEDWTKSGRLEEEKKTKKRETGETKNVLLIQRGS